MTKRKKNPHWGSTLDEFLDEEGLREAANAEAVTRVVA
jgi:antitoxin HicB